MLYVLILKSVRYCKWNKTLVVIINNSNLLDGHPAPHSYIRLALVHCPNTLERTKGGQNHLIMLLVEYFKDIFLLAAYTYNIKLLKARTVVLIGSTLFF